MITIHGVIASMIQALFTCTIVFSMDFGFSLSSHSLLFEALSGLTRMGITPRLEHCTQPPFRLLHTKLVRLPAYFVFWATMVTPKFLSCS